MRLSPDERRALSIAATVVTGRAINHKLKPGELLAAKELAGRVIDRLLGEREEADAIAVRVPVDLAESVALAIENHAAWFRQDTGHSAEGIAALRADAERLDAMVDDIRSRSKSLP